MSTQLVNSRVCFAGGGSMAEAIIRGLLEKRILPQEHLTVIKKTDAPRMQSLLERFDFLVTSDPERKQDALRQADVVVIAMKPKDTAEALAELAPFLRPDQLIVSVIAGISSDSLRSMIGAPLSIVRTMPNTSSTIGLSATGICFTDNVNETQRSIAMEMFEAIGIVQVVEEDQLHIVTGLSGSGPAYIYAMMEAMIEAAVEGGLERNVAFDFAVQTVLGASQMVRLTKEEPARLREKVTSPNGTTQAALETLKANHFQEAVKKAVFRAAERSREMGAAQSAKG